MFSFFHFWNDPYIFSAKTKASHSMFYFKNSHDLSAIIESIVFQFLKFFVFSLPQWTIECWSMAEPVFFMFLISLVYCSSTLLITCSVIKGHNISTPIIFLAFILSKVIITAFKNKGNYQSFISLFHSSFLFLIYLHQIWGIRKTILCQFFNFFRPSLFKIIEFILSNRWGYPSITFRFLYFSFSKFSI